MVTWYWNDWALPLRVKWGFKYGRIVARYIEMQIGPMCIFWEV